MVKNQIERSVNDMKQTLEAQGLTYDLYLTYIGMNDADFRASRKEETEKQIKTTLVLNELVKQNNLKAEENEVEEKIAELASKMKKSVEELKKTMNDSQRNVIESNIVSEKVINLLKEKNNI